MKLSLGNQLSILIGSTILVIVFSTIFVIQKITTLSLENSLDQSIQKRAYTVAAIISSDITTVEQNYAGVINGLASQELSFVPSPLRVVNSSGKPLVEYGNMAVSTIQQLDSYINASDIRTGHFGTVLIEGGDSLRAYSVALSDPTSHDTVAYVQILDSLSPIKDIERGLWRNGLISGAVGSFLAIIICQILMRRGFKPLHAVVEAIDKADYDNLSSGLKEEVSSAELQQLSRSLSAMWLRLDMAINKKRRVIGNMSHDLRTPLTALQGQLEVLLSQPSLTAETRDSLNRMHNEAERLTRMVTNMLLNVQLESELSLAVEDVNVKDILDETVADMWTLARGLELNIFAPRNAVISGRRDLLKQMLMNIIDNALKFTPKGGKIEIALTIDGGWVVIQVSDTGRGIPNNQLPHVMEAFYKAGLSQKSAGEGARLGLAIVKQIIQLHHGQIEIYSQEGSGTTVTVHLPLKDPGA